MLKYVFLRPYFLTPSQILELQASQTESSPGILGIWRPQIKKVLLLPPQIKSNSAHFEQKLVLGHGKSFFGSLRNLLSTLLTVKKNCG